MKTNQLLYEKVVGKARLGLVKDLNQSVADLQLSQLVPYIAKSEDIDVLLKNSKFIRNNQPLEFNGFASRQILIAADRYQEGLFGDSITYPKFIKMHPSLMSFPSELIWLTNNDGLNHFLESIKWILQRKSFSFDKNKAENLSKRFIELIKNNKETFSFWRELPQRYESELLSQLLMNITIELANHLKMRYISGLVPIIDYNTKTSLDCAHNVNMAYSHIVEDRRDQGFLTPKYFYTVCLSQTMIQRSNFDELEKVIKNVKIAMQQPLFDGIFVSVRGLSKISGEESKVLTLVKFINKLNEISQEESLPVWYSKFGLIGLNILDNGGSFASYHLNLSNIDDVYSTFNSNNKNSEKRPKHGKIFNKNDGRFYDADQLKKLIHSKISLPSYPDFPNQPTDFQLEHDTQCRKEFIKPYNILTMNHLNLEWLDATKDGEINHGKEFLSRCRDPGYYNIWGS